MAELKVEVSVEKAIHNAINDFAKHIFDKHGVRIDKAFVEWIDVTTCGGINMIVKEVRLETTSFQK